MNPRLAKEFRGILTPWSVAAALALLIPLRFALQLHGSNLVAEAFLTASPLVLAAAIALTLTAAYSSDFHFPVFQLLLSQPVSRKRIWSQKLAVSSVSAVSIVGLHLAVLGLAGVPVNLPLSRMAGIAVSGGNPSDLSVLAWCLFLLTTISAAGFWTLVTKNLVSSLALNVGSQIVWLLLLDAASRALFGTRIINPSAERGLESENFSRTDMLFFGALMYAAFFAWAGWRKFRNMQLVDLAEGSTAVADHENAAADTGARPHSAPELFRRKEAMLYRPVFLVGALFAVLWIVAAILSLSFSQISEVENFLAALSFFYIPVSLVLAGSISISEETRMGLFEWHLTLPLSRARFWMRKLALGAAIAFVFSVALPVVLAVGTFSELRSDFPNALFNSDGTWLLVMILALLFLLSFWAASYMRDVVRSALAAVLTAGIAMSGVAFIASVTSDARELQLTVLSWVVAYLHESFADARNQVGRLCAIAWLVVPGLALTLQSYRAFRRNLTGLGPFLRSAGMLIILVLLIGWWSSDLVRAAMKLGGSRLQQDVIGAVAALIQSGGNYRPETIVSLRELEETGKLSRATRHWLSGSRITVRAEAAGRNRGHVVTVSFPDNGTQVISVPAPAPHQRRSS